MPVMAPAAQLSPSHSVKRYCRQSCCRCLLGGSGQSQAAGAVHPPHVAALRKLLRALPRIKYHLLTIGERPMKRLISTSFLIFLTTAGLSAATPTFNKEVVRIFQQRCQSCHHP